MQKFSNMICKYRSIQKTGLLDKVVNIEKKISNQFLDERRQACYKERLELKTAESGKYGNLTL